MSYVRTSITRYGKEVTGFRSRSTGRFASVEDVMYTTFNWHSMNDACVQCKNLDGQVFYDQDLFQQTLWSPIWGDIINLDTGQYLTHGGTGINCRCRCEVRVEYDVMDLSNIIEAKTLLEALSSF